MSDSDQNGSRELQALKRAVVTIEQLRGKVSHLESLVHEPIAVVSAACRLPGGVESPEKFWQLLASGKDTRSEVPKERWDMERFYDPSPEAVGKICTRYGNFLERIEDFDPHFFGITPKDAQSMDPQHRLLLEVAWETFERCGQVPSRLEGSKTGVFIGITSNDYATLLDRANDPQLLNAYFITGNPLNAAAGRISYTFGLQGPAMAIDTACSSSLVAIHSAIKSLRIGECRQALAGGVNLILSPEISVSLSQAAMLAPDGRCKTFAKSADGYARGEGCGLVLLKRLSDALSDGDQILAVVRGSALNQDGASSGFTVPNGNAQQALLTAALSDAGVEPSEVSFIETHGTGTSLGDPIEVQALAKVLRSGDVKNSLYLGAVKAVVGHLESAAGITGFLKVVLSLANKQLPPQPKFGELNPEIPWQQYSLQLPESLTSWPAISGKRIAMVSSFGASGTNASIVLEEAPEIEAQPSISSSIVKRESSLFALSAKSTQALSQLALSLKDYISQNDCDLPQLAWSFNTARPAFNFRLPIVANSKAELIQQLELYTQLEQVKIAAKNVGSNPSLRAAFLFTGQGAQFLSMGEELYNQHSVFKDAFDLCDTLFSHHLNCSIKEVIFGKDAQLLRQTKLTQPALFCLEYSLYQLWCLLGIKPRVLLGHSIGEVAAACVGGVFSLEDGVKLVTARARLMQEAVGSGGMIAVQAGVEVLEQIAKQVGCDIGAYNAPSSGVLSAPLKVIDQIEQLCAERKIVSIRLDVSHAFHSAQMDQALKPFSDAISKITFSKPKIPIISNRTGELAGAEIATAAYWVEQIRRPVCFYQGVKTLVEQNINCAVELGPKPVLLNLVKAAVSDELRASWSWVASLQQHKQWEGLLASVSQIFASGGGIDWTKLADRKFKRLVVPSYPFERERCWALANPPIRDAKSQQTVASLPTLEEGNESFTSNTISAPVERVASLLSRVTGIGLERLDLATNFFELGVDSLMLVQFQQSIERSFSVRVDLQQFAERFDTLQKLGEHLATVAKVSQVDAASRQASKPDPQQAAPKQTVQVAGLYGKKKSQAGELDGAQWAHLNKLVARYNSKTPHSKDYASASRDGAFAHNRNSFFKREFKELTYLLAYEEAEGSRFKDIDGNSYIDITMGFGVHLLGHNPLPVRQAMAEEVNRGVAVGPLSRHAGEVAELISELAGVERVAFLNTGSEAVMVALRLVRAASGKNKVAIFAGAWHGSFDGVIATGYSQGEEVVTYPLAPGTTQGAVDDIIILRYGDPAAFETLEIYKDQLAAVVVEPVQSRNPSLQPREFVKQLREMTATNSIALIFDEMITGFRVQPDGAQGWYGVEADLVTYGKIVGGGLPIGVVAGKRQYLDSLDGGLWQFGDDSMPQVQPTLVAGTFNIHPLTMAAARAVLLELKRQGPSLQQALNEKVRRMCEELNQWYRENNFPLAMRYFGSLFRFEVSGELELLYYHLIDRGIFVWEGRNCFLSTAHTDEDVQAVIDAVKDSLLEMRADGWLKEKQSSSHIFPLSTAQQEIWFHTRLDSKIDKAYHEPFVLRISGRLDRAALEMALVEVVKRHELLRSSSYDGQYYRVDENCQFGVSYLSATEQELQETIHLEINKSFDLSKDLPWRLSLIELESGDSVLLFCGHHIAIDGWALGVFATELASFYQAAVDGSLQVLSSTFAKPSSFAQFVEAQENRHFTEAQREYWQNLFSIERSSGDELSNFSLDAVGGRLRRRLSRETVSSLEKLAKTQGVSLYAILLSAASLLLSKLTGEKRFFVAMPAALQPQLNALQLIGQGTTVLPLLVEIDDGDFSKLCSSLQHQLLTAQSNEPAYSAVASLGPRLNLIVNVDRRVELSFAGNTVELLEPEVDSVKVGLFVNAVVVDGQLLVDIDYSSSLFSKTEANEFSEQLLKVLDLAGKGVEKLEIDLLIKESPIDNKKLRSFLLQQFSTTSVASSSAYRAPQSELEIVVCEAVAEVLQLDRVGLNDNFFDLGGRSLTAIQLLSRLRDRLGQEISIEALFKVSSIGELSQQLMLLDEATCFPAILPQSSEQPLPLSFSQQRLWILHQHQVTGAAYNLSQSLIIHGELNESALEQAFLAVINRHDALRTNFIVEDGQPRQIVRDEVSSFLRVINKSAENEQQAQQFQDDIYREEAAYHFDLKQELLIKGVLLRIELCGETYWQLVVVLHHLVGDGWSEGILIGEVSKFYRAIVEDRGVEQLEPLPIQYGDYALWQRSLLQCDQYQQQIRYWESELSGMSELLELPTDYLRPAVQDFSGARFDFIIPGELSDRLQDLCSKFSISPFVLFSSAFAAILSRFSNSDDVAFGVAVANRNRQEIEGLIGFFVNTLVFRWELNQDLTFAELLSISAQKANRAFSNQDVSFEHLLEVLQPRRSASYQPLCQVFFAYQDMPQTLEVELPGVSIELLGEKDTGSSKFDLSLELSSAQLDDGHVFKGCFEYATALFSLESIEKLSTLFIRLLDKLSADPSRKIFSESLLIESERALLLGEWSTREQSFPETETVQSLFEISSQKYQQRQAIIYGDLELSYEQLNSRANKLAHYLLANGVERGDVVGISLERSVEMIVCVLAVLKTGASYMPLDVEYPKQRLVFMVEDASPKLLITSSEFANEFAATDALVLELEKIEDEVAKQSEINPQIQCAATDRAYVVYTSGSTGRPKGVAGHHRGLINRCAWMWREFPFVDGERVAQKTSYNFVDSLWETFGPLLQGASLIIVPPFVAKDPGALVNLLSQERATRIVLVPSLLRAILNLDQKQLNGLESLKHWTCSGEAISQDLVSKFYQTFPESILLNLYGQSEAAADCTWFDTREFSDQPSVPLGKPIPNNRIYLLDDNGQLVAPGMPGEIYVGGVGVAEGYLHQPELTEQRFVVDPFAVEADAKMFRTGDRARFLSDGNLVYLGRVDTQVKVRGFRIELSEIERCLSGVDSVRQALVVVRESSNLGSQLVAYLVTDSGSGVAADIRSELRNILPEYMVPSYFVFLKSFPLTPNGKLNRLALPEPDFKVESADHIDPRSETEQKISKIFVEILEQKKISIRDNFFDRGGHSLLATMVVSRVKEEFAVELSLQQFFQTPTIEGIAACVVANQSTQPRMTGRL